MAEGKITMETVKKIVIADSSTLLREGLKRLLPEMKDLLIAGEANDDMETMNVVENTKPDILLIDLHIRAHTVSSSSRRPSIRSPTPSGKFIEAESGPTARLAAQIFLRC